MGRNCFLLIDNQIADIMMSAQSIGNVVEKQFGCTSLTTVIQDGPQAGQTVINHHHHHPMMRLH